MNTSDPSVLPEVVAELLRRLLGSAKTANGGHLLDDAHREILLDWLQRVLVDRDALHAHIRELQGKDTPVRYNQPLSDELSEQVVQCGLGSFDSSQLMELALNSTALV